MPSWARSNFPRLTVGGAGERPLLVAEELALDQVLGDGGAVDLHKGAGEPGGCRRWMARATSSLPVPFSPVMSTQASVGATRSGSAPGAGGSARSPPMISGGGGLLAQPPVFLGQAGPSSSPLRTGQEEPFRREGLFDEIIGPQAGGLHGRLEMPWPDIMMTGRRGRASRILTRISRPSMPGIQMSRSTRSGDPPPPASGRSRRPARSAPRSPRPAGCPRPPAGSGARRQLLAASPT